MNTLVQASLRQLYDKTVIAVQFPNTAELNGRFRQLAGAHWSNTLKSWCVPDTATYRKRFGVKEEPVAGKEMVQRIQEPNRNALKRM